MDTHAEKKADDNYQAAAVSVAKKEPGNIKLELKDHRPEAAAQANLKERIAKIARSNAQNQIIQAKSNTTGLPDTLKAGLENLSGFFMDDVKVHYNSSKPSQLQAHAYAQGNQIHLAPGQEKHLPHEAWHVVQQKQGRVKPTFQMKGKVNVNDDDGLEKEADSMGMKAKNQSFTANTGVFNTQGVQQQAVIQREWVEHTEDEVEWIPARSGLKWFYNTKTRNMRFEPENGVDIGELGRLMGQKQSYRAWIKEWAAHKYIDARKANKLSFAGYAANIHEIYPPDKFEYVGIGASCDLVLEYLRQKFNTTSSSIPISGLTNAKNTNTDQWDSEHNKRLLQYILAFIPAKILNGRKKILLMDVVSGGNTLTIMKQLFQKLIVAHQGNPDNISCLSLNGAMNPKNEFLAGKQLAVTSGPVDPKQVISRKPNEKELAEGFVPSGTVLTRAPNFKITKKIKKLKRALKTEELSQEDRQEIEKRIVRNEKRIYEYYPILYDRLLTDTADRNDQNSVEVRLDSQLYKDIGRTHRKVDFGKIASGETDAEQEKKEGVQKNPFPEIVREMLRDEE